MYLMCIPKCILIAAYLRVPFKHAYEVIDDVRGCHPFLDLPIYSSAEYEAACRVLCTAASDELRSVAGPRFLAPRVPDSELDLPVAATEFAAFYGQVEAFGDEVPDDALVLAEVDALTTALWRGGSHTGHLGRENLEWPSADGSRSLATNP
jgi:hypothetical protein